MMGQAILMTNNSTQLEKAPAVEQGGPAGSPSLLPDTTQKNLEPGNLTEKSLQRTVRTLFQGKKEGRSFEFQVVSALAADAATFLSKRRARQTKGEEPSQSMDALAAGKESTGSAEREKRKRRPSSRFLNGTSAVSPAAAKVKSPITPVISANAAEAGPEAETPSTKRRRRLSKLPIKSTKKIQSPKAKIKKNDTVASSGEKHQVDKKGGNRAAVIPATEGTPLFGGGSGSRSTQVNKRGRPRKSPIGNTDSPEGKLISRFFAGPSEARETPVQVPEGSSSKGGDAGTTKTYRKRKGKPQKCLNIGSGDDLPAAGLSSLGDEAGGGSQKKTDKGTPMNKAGDSQKKTDKQTPMSKAGESEKKTDKETPTSTAVMIEWGGSSVFIKSSPLWKALAEIEVFHKFPQNPHFHPLADVKESYREGLAIGNMVSFASIVDKVFKLKFTDSADSINACLKTLFDLEVHGFDITVIRDHLRMLLSIKEGQEKLRERMNEVENQTEELTAEKIKIDEEIFEFNEKMECLGEGLAAAKSRKEKKDSEIGNMVNFANIVHKACKLKFNHSSDSINACLRTLLDLEVHGFDITVIRDHVMKLLLIKEGQEKLRERMKEVENQTEELTAEKIKIDEEIFDFNEKIERLGEKLAAAKSRKEKKDSEIGDLKAKLASMSKLIDGAALNVKDGANYYPVILSYL